MVADSRGSRMGLSRQPCSATPAPLRNWPGRPDEGRERNVTTGAPQDSSRLGTHEPLPGRTSLTRLGFEVYCSHLFCNVSIRLPEDKCRSLGAPCVIPRS